MSSETLARGLAALYEQTEQRIRDGVRSVATLEMQRAHGRWLLAELGDLPLGSLDELALERLTAPTVPPRRFGASTLRKRLSTLRGVLALAHRRRQIPRMPAWPVVIVPWRPRQRFLRSYADAVRLFEALPPHRALWMWLCLWTAQHASDVERMSWSEVSLDGEAPWYLRRCTKTRQPALRVAMPRPLLRVLMDVRTRERPAPEARIVRPWPSRKHTLPMACFRLGLPPCNAIDLRHTLISWLVARIGMVTPAVLAIAGHTSPAMVARTYAHVLPPALSEATAALNSLAESPDPAETRAGAGRSAA